MIKVGLTGGIGSGKSTVSNFLSEKGIPIVDADVISRDVLILYKELSEKIKENFGDEFFDKNGIIKRRQLGNFIFKNEKSRKKLEEIIIPYIKKEIFDKIKKYEAEGQWMCVVDAPTLIENNLHTQMDKNILIWVDKKTQIERVMMRDLLSKDKVMDRIASQMSLDEKKKYVDFIIDNRGNIEDTKKQIKDVLRKLGGIQGEYA